MLGFGLGVVCGGLAVASLLGLRPQALLAELSLPELPTLEEVGDRIRGRETVLVIDVREPERAAAVRASVRDERVVAESPRGFALRERRLVVSSLAEAGSLLGSAGWAGARLQILRFEPRRETAADADAKESNALRRALLMQQPTLTLFEAQQALALL